MSDLPLAGSDILPPPALVTEGNAEPRPCASPFGSPVLNAKIRSTPEDFFVEELPAFDASGEGEHLLLMIEKRGMNTAFVAQTIARWAGVPESAVGYAGMKDRHAVTRQRFSVHLPGRESPEVSTLESDDLHVLSTLRHARKLQRGALRGNRFKLVLREIVGERFAIEQRLAEIATRGFPNYFGEQRFGHGGGNLEAAQRMFEDANPSRKPAHSNADTSRKRRIPRDKRGILLSAARSELFNRVLAARVVDGSWCRGLPGELWMLSGTRSVFGPEPDPAALAERIASHDVHATGPLWGRGVLRTDAACRALEESVLEPYETIRVGLEQAGLAQERRALCVVAAGLRWEWLEEQVMELQFELPPGSYATSFLQSLGSTVDVAQQRIPG
ncbi:MAG: tRNA pseudouridine(13) synthase TruD [Lysobacteraceae bacterium]